MTPVIIEAALNGATPKRRNPNVPRTPDENAACALACLDAGAAIVHHHTDDAVVGGAVRHASEPYAAAWRPVLAARPDALLYPTMAGAAGGIAIEERYVHLIELFDAGLLTMGLADPGSFSLAGVRADGRLASSDGVYVNSSADAAWMFAWCAERELPVTASIFEPGFLRLALAHHERGTLPRGTKLQLYFGGPSALFGLPPTPASLDTYLGMLDGSGLTWMVGVQGGDVLDGLAAAAIERGGHVRVGLEDHAGPTTPSNEELVARVVELAGAANRPAASCEEARSILFG